MACIFSPGVILCVLRVAQRESALSARHERADVGMGYACMNV